MPDDLPTRRRTILAAIDFITAHNGGWPPTPQEIHELTLIPFSSVHLYIKLLQKEGLVETHYKGGAVRRKRTAPADAPVEGTGDPHDS